MRLVVFLIGMALALAACAGSGGPSSTPSTVVVTVSAPPTTQGPCLDAATAQAEIREAIAADQDVIAAAASFDLEGAADASRVVGLHLRRAAVAASADPVIAGYLNSAAAEVEDAATFIEAGDFEAATQAVNASTADIGLASTAIETTSVSACGAGV